VPRLIQHYNNSQVLPKELEIYGRVSVCAPVLFSCVCDQLDNATSRKGLDARQAAFANKKYKSHRRVGLTGNIIAAINAKDS